MSDPLWPVLASVERYRSRLVAISTEIGGDPETAGREYRACAWGAGKVRSAAVMNVNEVVANHALYLPGRRRVTGPRISQSNIRRK